MTADRGARQTARGPPPAQYRDGPLQLYENGWFILKNSVAPPGTSVLFRVLYCYRVLLVHAFI